MSTKQRTMPHALEGATLADVLERILDKGLVIAGDIKIKLVDIELLTIQIRLLIASVDKAREIGMDWWVRNPEFVSQPVKAIPAPPPAYSSPSAVKARGRKRVPVNP